MLGVSPKIGSPLDERQPLMLQRSRAAAALSLDDPLQSKPKVLRPAASAKYEGQCISIDEVGHVSYFPMRKGKLVTELGLRHRDVRALEPGVALAYPASIFVRKQAVVLNLEGLKVIISQYRALIISVPPPDNLSSRQKPMLDSPIVTTIASLVALNPESSMDAETQPSEFSTTDMSMAENRGISSDGMHDQNLRPNEKKQTLPFELRALEASLLTAVAILGREVNSLENAARPLLRRIRQRVERQDIEELFEVQSKLDKAVSRVSRIREVLEEILDDDEELSAMCLSRSEVGADVSGSSPRVRNFTIDEEAPITGADSEDEEFSEVQDLFEAHWLQSDYLLSKLRTMQQSISRTQHMVNLDLDSKRNALVALGLVIDVVLMSWELHMTITAVFGMNMESGLERWEPYSVWVVAAIATVIAATVTLLTLRWVWNRGLLYLPSFGLRNSLQE